MNGKANESRQKISAIYTHIRKILQDRETDLKMNISSNLQAEESRLKECIKEIRSQLNGI
jgi:hypothetical protein